MCCESISMITEKVEDPSLLSELQSEHRIIPICRARL